MPVPPGDPLEVGPNLLLITLDTLRADHLGSYGHEVIETPHLDRLAEEGIRFEQVSSVAPLTLPSHTSILTGQYPFHHGVRDNSNFRLDGSALTLQEVLRSAGYATGGFIGAFVLD
ncbi:MAG: sulfatase, partial [Acidobacteriota bacterium]